MDERYAIVGAQPYENFVSALEQIEQEAGIQFQAMHYLLITERQARQEPF